MAIRTTGPGKFEGGNYCDVWAYETSLDGADAEVGDVSEGGHASLLRGPFQRLGLDITEDLNADEARFILTQRGCIVFEDSYGFVSVSWFDETDELEAAWADIEAYESGRA